MTLAEKLQPLVVKIALELAARNPEEAKNNPKAIGIEAKRIVVLMTKELAACATENAR